MKNNSISLILLIVLIPCGAAFGQPELAQNSHYDLKNIDYFSRPLAFTRNDGQFGDETRFRADVGGVTIFLCNDEVVYLFSRDTDELLNDDPRGEMEIRDKFNRPRYKKEFALLKAHFIGAGENVEVVGRDLLPNYNNYFIGNDPFQWHTDVPNYSTVTYRNIYPGIDLKYYGDGKSLKYDFIVHPGADPSAIEIRYEGAQQLNVSSNGDLEAVTDFGPAYEKAPLIYQKIDGARHEISGRYRKKSDHSFGFELDSDYNPAYPLIIDPALVFSSYLGEDGIDEALAIAVDSEGCAYITGFTYSVFHIINGYQPVRNGTVDGFVTKVAPNGHSLIYSTFFGGSETDMCTAIKVDQAGNAIFLGETMSDDLPVLNAYSSARNGGIDLFIAKLNNQGNSLIFCTYLGGPGGEFATDMDIDFNANVYVLGHTEFDGYPVVNAYDESYNGDDDIIVSKLSASGQDLIYSTYLGGSLQEEPYNIDVGPFGTAVVGGATLSYDYPLQNPLDSTIVGYREGIISKLSENGDSLIFSTYFGGFSSEIVTGIDLDDNGNVIFGGGTVSSDFPLLNPIDSTMRESEAFIAACNATGDSLFFSTFIGGGLNECLFDLELDINGNINITGYTSSSDFPLANPYDSTFNGFIDDFVATISNAGNMLLFSTFFGGTMDDYSLSIACDDDDGVYICGYTHSSDLPMINPFQDYYTSSEEGFFAKFGTTYPCDYVIGDANGSGGANGLDVVYMVSYFKGGPLPPVSCDCPPYGQLFLGADTNGSCSVNGLDVSYMVNYLKGIGTLHYCSDCPPSG